MPRRREDETAPLRQLEERRSGRDSDGRLPRLEPTAAALGVVGDDQGRTLRRAPTRVQISSTMTAPMTEPMIPAGWKKPPLLWKIR